MQTAALAAPGWTVPGPADFQRMLGKIGQVPVVNVMARCACVCHSACACKCNCVCSGSCSPTPTGKCPW